MASSGRRPKPNRGRAMLNGRPLTPLQQRRLRIAGEDIESGDPALERLRGETIEVSKDAHSRGRVRIRSRDGLETLAACGAITPTQHRAGLLYRGLYEATDPERGLKSHMHDLDRPGGGPGGVAEGWAERRLRLARTIAAIEAKVRMADRNDRAVRALREVAGHARCLAQLASGGGAQASYRRALGLALDVCADHFRT